MVDVTMTMEEYLNLLNGLSGNMEQMPRGDEPAPTPTKTQRRASAYQRKYKANFKKIAKKYQTKSGKWRKNGFRSAVKEAHRMTKK